MKKIIKRMQELVNYLECMVEDAYARDDDQAFELDATLEKAGDLLYGFITGNFEDSEVTRAKKMLKYWDF